MTSSALKIIDCITMFIDHLSYSLFGEMTWLNYIGRIAFPIFAFQITEGYLHTKNFMKYLFRIGIFAIISQLPFMLFHSITSDVFALNVFFTLFLGLLCIYFWDKLDNKLLSIFITIIFCFIAEYSNMDYGYWGVLLILVFYLFKNNKLALVIAFFSMIVLKYLPNMLLYNFYYKYILLFCGTFLSFIPILLYNGKQGKKIKYFLYIFYPVHLLLLYGLHCLL